MFTKRFSLWAVALLTAFGFTTFEAEAANPVFNSIGAVSDNANNQWAKSGDTITFSLGLTVAEDSDGSGIVTFSIGGLTGQTATFPAAGAATSHTATYNVPGGSDGPVLVTGITFQNTTTETITGIPPFPTSPSPNVMVDNTAPVFNAITAISNNVNTTKAKEGDNIVFTLTLATADSWNAGNTLNYSVGAGTSTPLAAAFISTSGVATKTTATRSFNVVAGQDGLINIDSLTFTDRAGNAITGFAAGAPTPNVTVDTTVPIIAFTDDVAAGPVMDDDIEITVTETDGNTATYEYGYSADAICDATDTYGNAFTSGASFNINTDANSGEYICAKTEDNSGNVTFQASANPLNLDTTGPTILSVTQVGNASWPRYVKSGDTVTYNITYSEAATVSAINTASSASNATGTLTEVSAALSATDTLIVTVQAGDNGEIIPVVNFDLTDAANNTTTITSLGAITGGGFDNKIFADTTFPTLSSVMITSDNSLDTAWAKNGDTITLNFTASEELKNGQVSVTMAGKTATVTPGCANAACTSYTATIMVDGSETEGVTAFTISFEDRASNDGVDVAATTDMSTVSIDYTAPTLPLVSIASSNALDTTLAKTNDTITVTFTVADNLATNASISGAPTILGLAATNTVTSVAAGQTISRFTDGTETSETVVPFSFIIQDEAGNTSSAVTATTDASSVQFDRIDPLVSNVQISATSIDSSAFMGDAPTYYAKQGDTIDFSFEVCDYVDSQNNAPTGDLFSSVGLTMTDDGLTATTCTTPGGNTTNTRKWSAQLTNIDGTEGLVTFDIDVYDNAGNGLVNVIGTTDSSSVIFDKTDPTLPTDVVDLDGVETTNFKHNSRADYTWTNDEDPLGVAPVSDIQNYDIRFNNPNTGINEMVTINAPNKAFTPTQTIPDLNAPYTVNMNIRDKAGNDSGEQVVYTQLYAPGIVGRVTDTNGRPLSNVTVQVVSRFGETCNTPAKVCTTTTDGNGEYFIVTEPSQSYTVNYWDSGHYLEKAQVEVPLTDVTVNVKLAPITTPKQVQGGNQTLVIATNETFKDANGITQSTLIYASSLGGDTTVTTLPNGDIKISALSQIASVISNNPNVVALKNTDNTYTVVGAGSITAQSPGGTSRISGSLGGATIANALSSGTSRLGVQENTGNGDGASRFSGMSRDEFVGHGKFWTPEQSMEYARLANEGHRYKVNTYVNRNGYQIFAGYTSGKLPLTAFDKRFQNQVAYRGGKIRTTHDNRRRVNVVKEAKNLTAKTAEMKQRFQKPVVEMAEETKPRAGYARSKTQDVISGVMAKRHYQNHQQHKFARTRYHNNKASRIAHKDLSTIRISHGGKSVALSAMYRQQATR